MPGATLAEPIEKQSILTLKQWLLCQEVKMPNSAKDTVNKKVSEIFFLVSVILCHFVDRVRCEGAVSTGYRCTWRMPD